MDTGMDMDMDTATDMDLDSDMDMDTDMGSDMDSDIYIWMCVRRVWRLQSYGLIWASWALGPGPIYTNSTICTIYTIYTII